MDMVARPRKGVCTEERKNQFSTDVASRSRSALAPEFCSWFPPSSFRGRRECRAPDAPDSRVCNSSVESAHALVRSHRNHPALPAQWFTAYIVLSPATGLSCHRRAEVALRELDASVGASGPHVFAVRVPRRSLSAPSASTASRPASVTIADRPSEWDGMEWQYPCFYLAVKRNFGNSEIDTPLRCGFNDLRTRQRILQTACRANQLGRRHKTCSRVLFAQCPLCPDSDQMLPRNEMTRCAMSGTSCIAANIRQSLSLSRFRVLGLP